jgi:hypothetical protein
VLELGKMATWQPVPVHERGLRTAIKKPVENYGGVSCSKITWPLSSESPVIIRTVAAEEFVNL